MNSPTIEEKSIKIKETNSGFNSFCRDLTPIKSLPTPPSFISRTKKIIKLKENSNSFTQNEI